MSGPECPTDAELNAFVIGTLSEAALESLARHLERCPGCEARVQRLDERSDPLIEGLRRGAPPQGNNANPLTPGQIGDYRLRREIGRGGMGIVYEAEQISLNRRVALKILPRHALLDASAIERFRREARAAARLHHTNIVPIYGTGEEAGLHYFAMQYISGAGLDTVIREMRRQRHDTLRVTSNPPGDLLTTSARACISDDDFEVTRKAATGNPASASAGTGSNPDTDTSFPSLALPGGEHSSTRNRTYWTSIARVGVQVGDALEYAHSQGVIHRDIKPSNLLLDSEGLVWVTDFGLAKGGSEHEDLTNTGDLIGTLRYTPPERFEGVCDARGDVYSLGLTLYEFLTLQPAFSGAERNQLLRQVMHGEPPRPRSLVPSLPRDLETIVLKAIARDPAQRYRRAGELANDLRRFIDGQPIHARPTPAWELVWKATRRHPGIAGLTLALILVALVGFGLVAWQWQRAEEKARDESTAREAAEQSERHEQETRRRAEREAAGVSLAQGSALCEAGEIDRGLLMFAHALIPAERAESPELAAVARYNLAAWRALFVTNRATLPHRGWTWAAAWSPDGTRVLTGGQDGFARIWEASTGKLLHELPHPHAVWAVAWNRDGSLVLTGCGHEKKPVGSVQLWNAQSGKPTGAAITQPEAVSSVAFSPDGSTFLIVCATGVELWHTTNGRSLAGPLPHPRPSTHNENIFPQLSACYSPDGTRILTAGEDGTARLWDARTGQPKNIGPLKVGSCILTAAFSPDGKVIATGTLSGAVQIWDAETGATRTPPLIHRGPVKALAFRPDGQVLASAGVALSSDPGTERVLRAGEARLWHTGTGMPIGTALAHPAPVWSVAFSPDGRLLATGGVEEVARLFLVANGALVGQPLGRMGFGNVTSLAFDRTGTALLTTGAGGNQTSAARVWDVAMRETGGRLFVQPGTVRTLTFDPESQVIVAGGDRTARLWDVATGRHAGPELPHPDLISSVAFSGDGRTILTGTGEPTHARGSVLLWDRSSGARLREFPLGESVTATQFTTNDRTGVATTIRGKLFAWSADTGTSTQEPLPDVGLLLAMETRDKGRTLLIGTDGAAGLWDRESARWRFRFEGLRGDTSDVTISADGKRAVLVTDGFAQLFALDTGRTLGPTAFHPEGRIKRLALTPDGTRVLIASRDGSARLWDFTTGRQLGPPLGTDVQAVSVSPDGRYLATGGTTGRISVWEPVTPRAGDAQQIRAEMEQLTGLVLDAQGVIRPRDATDR